MFIQHVWLCAWNKTIGAFRRQQVNELNVISVRNALAVEFLFAELTWVRLVNNMIRIVSSSAFLWARQWAADRSKVIDFRERSNDMIHIRFLLTGKYR